MRLSIIIPVYGVEKFVADCILSCIDNICSYSEDVEVIVVDDGCLDTSMDIVNSLISDKKYFRTYSQKNQGLSVARNKGLDLAVGEYVWFVDSDDFIAKGIVDVILNTIHAFGGADIIELDYEKVEEDANYTSLQEVNNGSSSSYLTTGQNRFLTVFRAPVQFHVFRRTFLLENELKMYPNIYHEDNEFTPRALWKANKVVVIPQIAYYYRQRQNSIMHSINPKKGEDNLFVSNNIKFFFDREKIGYEDRRIINGYISTMFCNGLQNAVGAEGESLRRIQQAAYKYRDVLECLRNSNQLKYKILGIFSTLFPNRTVQIYLIMKKVYNLLNKH